MGEGMIAIALMLIIVATQVGITGYWRRKYQEALREVVSLRNELNAKAIRFAEAPPAGTPIVVTYSTGWQTVEPQNFDEMDWKEHQRALEDAAQEAYRQDMEARLHAYQQQYFRNSGTPGF